MKREWFAMVCHVLNRLAPGNGRISFFGNPIVPRGYSSPALWYMNYEHEELLEKIKTKDVMSYKSLSI